MIEFIVNVALALVTGFAVGISAGLVVARMAKFEELRNEARRIIWGIDYIYAGGGRPRITERRPTGELLYVSSELYALKHVTAGETVSQLLQVITTTLYSPPGDVEAMNQRYADWQRTCRELKPEKKIIFGISWRP